MATESFTTHMLLVRCRLAGDEGLAQAAQHFCGQSGLGLRLHRAAWGREHRWSYVYGELARPAALRQAQVAPLAQLWASLCPGATGIDVSRLERVQDVPGASFGAQPTRHYVVETDPEPDWEEEIVRWYVEEHMPGLAAVPGTVHARRFLNHDAGPRSHAYYELVTEDTFGCPPWLAVRGSEWSSRVRPHFTNTRRTMMAVVG